MQSHLVSWIIVLGMATAVTGCSSTKSSGETKLVDTSNHQWLKRQNEFVQAPTPHGGSQEGVEHI